MTSKAHIRVSLRTFNSNALDGLERRFTLFSQYIKKKYKEVPVLTNQEWLEEFKAFSNNKEELSLNDLIKAFLDNED